MGSVCGELLFWNGKKHLNRGSIVGMYVYMGRRNKHPIVTVDGALFILRVCYLCVTFSALRSSLSCIASMCCLLVGVTITSLCFTIEGHERHACG